MQIGGEEVEVRPLTRDEYHRLGALGCFDEEKVELLDGVIVKMSPTGQPHNDIESLLSEHFVKSIPSNLLVRPQCSFALSKISEPEPDLTIVDRLPLRGPDGRLVKRDHPSFAYLIVEIAASSLRKDLGLKAQLYAKAGVHDYWVVDVDQLEITVHRDVYDMKFTSVQRFDRFARVQSLLVPEVSVCLDELVR